MNEPAGLILITVGIAYDLLACLGVVRMPDIYTRLQAATKAVTVGTTFILAGAAIYAGPGPLAAKALLCLAFVLLTNPASAHVIARAAHSSGIRVERVTADGLLGREIESELWDVTRRSDLSEKDRLIHIIERCLIMDIKEHMTSESLFEIISHPISRSEGLPAWVIADKLKKREREAVTALKPDFAIPHIIIEGQGSFELVSVRARRGIWFSDKCPRVTSIFVMAGTQDEWHFYLRTLAALAQMVRTEGFFDKWSEARDEKELRKLLISELRKIRKEGKGGL